MLGAISRISNDVAALLADKRGKFMVAGSMFLHAVHNDQVECGGVFGELLSNLVYGIQAAFSVDCSSSCLPSLKMTLLTTKVNKLNP